MNSAALYQDIATRKLHVSVCCGKDETIYTYDNLRDAVKFFYAMIREELNFSRIAALFTSAE